MTLRIGSLCSGVGMLDLAVESVFPGAELAWYAQYEPPDKDGKPDRHQYAARIMAHHWPGVPNHGDITAIDYTQVEPVDVLTAGFPCTDLSLAGKRAGLMPGTRSGVWSHVARAVGVLRPPLVLIENVRSLTSAKAHSDVEFCPGCMGGPGGGDAAVPHLRALGCVLGDLADLGFDAQWVTLAASSVGAPHKRERVFVLAWPAADAARLGHERRGGAWGWGRGSAYGGLAASDAQGVGRDERRPEPAGVLRGSDAAERCGPAVDSEGVGRRPEGQQHGLGTAQRSEGTPTDTQGTGRQGPRPEPEGGRPERGDQPAADPHGDTVREQPVALAGGGGAPVARVLGTDACPTCGCGVYAHDAGGFCASCGACADPELGRPAPASPDAEGERHGHAGPAGVGGIPSAALAGGPAAAADPDGGGRGPREPDDAARQPAPARRTAPNPDEPALGAQRHGEQDGPETDHGRHRLDASGRFLGWGPYTAAIERWEAILGQPAPSPVDDRGRLNPPLPEWMMGLPAGWVTGVPGVPRNAQLKALGNGCVVQQAVAALGVLLPAYVAACEGADGFGLVRNGIRQQAAMGVACGDTERAA